MPWPSAWRRQSGRDLDDYGADGEAIDEQLVAVPL